MKKIKFLHILVITFLAIISIYGCKKEFSGTDPLNPANNMNDIRVPKGFTFNNSGDVHFIIYALSQTNESMKSVPVKVYTDFEENGGTLLFTGITNQNGVFETTHPLPNRLTEVIVSTTYLGLPDYVIGTVTDGKVEVVLGGAAAPSFKSGSLPFKSLDFILQGMGTYNSLGVPDSLVVPNDSIGAGLLALINSSIPEYQNVPNVHPEWVDPNINYDIELLEESQVWVTFVDEGACWTNALGFYSYDLSNPPASKNDIAVVNVIFPNASEAGGSCGVGGLVAGNKMYLGQFPANTGIGIVLLTKGWSTSSHTVGLGTNQLYSNPNFNPQAGGVNAAQRQQFVMLYDDVRDILLTGVEDQVRPDGDKDFNDLVFFITTVAVTAIDSTGYHDPIPAPDVDGDGVPDSVDEYPTDPDRAFNVYYPAQNTFGTLAFEDLWPSKGDYDFNDMLVDYNITHVTNADNDVVDAFGKLRLRAMGAGYHNGFGIQLNVAPASIAGIEYTFEDASTLDQPLEDGQAKAVFILWQDGFNLLRSSGGIGVNTTPSVTPVDPYELDFAISTTAPVSIVNFGIPPYNPFIYVNQERGKEVHLLNFPPTSLVSPLYFGTFDDASVPASLSYYTTTTGLPWAIHISESMDYPIEKAPVISAYTHFAEWAQSGGTLFPDWYMDKPGYRVIENIYP